MSLKEELLKDFQAMKQLRNALGYTTDYGEYYLKPFIEYCTINYSNAETISKEMIDGWLLERPFQTNATRSHAISDLRTFTRFLNSIGRKAFIPTSEYSLPVEHYRPYIFTDAELLTLFQAIDTIPPCFEAPDREIIVPVLFRMMYCCGMRPAEPLHLRKEDIDIDSGEIYIRQSKNKKDRHIIMSDDLQELCRKYDVLAGSREWFFQKWDGGPFPTYWMTNQFRICWKRSGLEKRGNPRPYDLRHCFATRTLMRWVDEERDIMALLPYLSTYMGHKSFKHTLYYIHLLPNRLRTTAGIDWARFDCIYSEENAYEID